MRPLEARCSDSQAGQRAQGHMGEGPHTEPEHPARDPGPLVLSDFLSGI